MKIVCLGDSLTRGYGVRVSESWPVLLAQRAKIEVVNQGINGDTTGGMLARFEEDVIKLKPTHVLIMGGVNDLMFEVPMSVIKANIAAMVQKTYHHKITPILGISTPIITEDANINWDIIGDFGLVESRLAEYREWLLEYAAYFRVKVLDFYGCFEELKPNQDSKDLFFDGLHLTAEGNGILSRFAFSLLFPKKQWE